jgi:secretion/DNA translocation related TadE-like protein
VTRNPDERGNVTVLVTAVTVAAIVLCAALAHFSGAVVEKARAENAADAAALAAADGLALGRAVSEACSDAVRTAADNGARVLTCRYRGSASRVMTAEVTVAVGAARARARATADDRLNLTNGATGGHIARTEW